MTIPSYLEFLPAPLRARIDASAEPVPAVPGLRVARGLRAAFPHLLTDEALWRADLDPARPARSLDPDEVRRLHRTIRSTLRTLQRRGGSHTGDLMGERVRGGRCPCDGAPLLRRTIGGRTTYSCPRHQR